MDDAHRFPEDLARRYVVRRVLGQGSFGQVVEAADVELERVVAIKLLRAEMQDEEAAARFAREGRLTAQLQHPHVVACHEHGVSEDGTPFLVYELIQGETLLERMQRVGLRPPGEIRSIGAAIASALEAAHAAGILHRDVKPENIMLRPDGTPVLCDFGVAYSEEVDAVKTAEGIILGTLEYMAPELMLGVAASPATDAFALGATLYMLRFGEAPYPGTSPGELAAIAQGTTGPRPPTTAVADEALDQVLLRATAPRPERRHPDLATLRAALGGEEVDRVRDTVVLTASSPDLMGTDTAGVKRPSPPPSRRRLVPWLLGVAGLLGLAGTGLWWSQLRTPVLAPAATEPAQPAPDREVVPAEVRDSWIRFVGYRRGPGREPDLVAGTQAYRDENLESLSQALLDTRFELRTKRFMDRLGKWLTEGDPEALRTPQARDFLVEVTTVLDWIARDFEYSALRSTLGMRTLHDEGAGIQGAFREIDRAIAYATPFAQLGTNLEGVSVEAMARGATPAAILLRAVWAAKYEGGDPASVAGEIWEVFYAQDDPVLAAELLPWLAKLTLEGEPVEVDCAEVIGRTEELMDLAGKPGRAPGRELWLLRQLSRTAARVAERCDRSGMQVDWAGLAGAVRAAENAPLARVESLDDIITGLEIARLSAQDLLGSPEALPPALATTPLWSGRRAALGPILANHADAFALPADADEPGTARRLDEAEGALLRRAEPETIRDLAVALVHWVELRRRLAPEELVAEAPRLRIQGALESLFDELASASPETALWVDGALVRLATATPPRDPCLAGTLRALAQRRGLPSMPWLPPGPCLD